MSKKTKSLWVHAAVARAIYTIIEALLAIIVISWVYKTPFLYAYIFWIAPLSGVLSIIMSAIMRPPETRTDGVLKIDTHNPEKDIYRMSLDGDISNLPKKKIVIFTVDPNADLSHE